MFTFASIFGWEMKTNVLSNYFAEILINGLFISPRARQNKKSGNYQRDRGEVICTMFSFFAGFPIAFLLFNVS